MIITAGDYIIMCRVLWKKLPHLFKECYSLSSVINPPGHAYNGENIKTVTNGSDYFIVVREYFQKVFKAGTTQVTRIYAKTSATGADSDLNQTSNRYILTRL